MAACTTRRAVHVEERDPRELTANAKKHMKLDTKARLEKRTLGGAPTFAETAHVGEQSFSEIRYILPQSHPDRAPASSLSSANHTMCNRDQIIAVPTTRRNHIEAAIANAAQKSVVSVLREGKMLEYDIICLPPV